MQTRIDMIYNLLNAKGLLLQSLLDRANGRTQSRVILTEHERDLLKLIEDLKKRIQEKGW